MGHCTVWCLLHRRSDRERMRGYTLVEFSIVLIIVGLLFGGAAAAYKHYGGKDVYAQNGSRIESITSAIGAYRAKYGRYPCPASLSATPGNPLYGEETDCSDTTVAPGTCNGGICIQRGLRADARLPDGTLITPRVRVGGIPFRSLNMIEPYSYDGFGRRIVYVMTEHLGQTAFFDDRGGGIAVVDARGGGANSLISPPASAHFIILSHGLDGKGATGKNGVTDAASCAGPAHDVENCDMALDALYVDRPLGTAGGADDFDDRLSFYTWVSIPLWRASDQNGLNIHNTLLAGGVGIKRTDPVPRIDVNGIAFTSAGNNIAGRPVGLGGLCADGGMDCWSSSNIGGTAMIPCPAGEVMSGIRNGQPICTAPPGIGCPDQSLLRGINALGRPVCGYAYAATDPDCGPSTQTVCSVTINLPGPRPSGTRFTSTTPPAVFLCYRGTWRRIGIPLPCGSTLPPPEEDEFDGCTNRWLSHGSASATGLPSRPSLPRLTTSCSTCGATGMCYRLSGAYYDVYPCGCN